ncbi:MAG: type II toxin-antitoxin system VapC family toxin [Desulfobacterales bacterium]|nr:type II toxin-antitoxin system VapC family toxin [Desulfobacterales bacterium]
MNRKPPVIYWDTSAIVSVLFKDDHSERAHLWAGQEGIHLISSLGYAEACAVLSRIQREGALADILIKAAYEVLESGPWRRLHLAPAWEDLRELSAKWPLRGADLWHLATAKHAQTELPELVLLSFDDRLKTASEGEGLGIDLTQGSRP